MQSRGTAYDPWGHADQLEVKVRFEPLRNASGLWVPEARTILLRPGMRRILERTVLAHELGHAYFGHFDDRPKHERQADRFAAWHLIDCDELREVSETSSDPSAWCHALGFSLRLLRFAASDSGLVAA